MEIISDIPSLIRKVMDAFYLHDNNTAFTVGISGIDASGKGYTTRVLQEELENMGYKVANINIDPWQNPIPVRLRTVNPAENFYKNVFRWTDFFEQLIMPLKHNKRIHLLTQHIRTDADIYYQHFYQYENIDILLVEGILLFQERWIPFFDHKVWIECGFDTALQRAIRRNVEKLDEKKLIVDYHTYYYAAQRLHFQKDVPQNAADVIFYNDLVSELR